MYARVSTWEGAEPEAIRQMAEMIEGSDAPPDGVPSNGITVLYDKDSKRAVVVALFETEEDRRKGDETLKEMTPPSGDAMGRHTSTDFFDVATEKRLSGAASS